MRYKKQMLTVALSLISASGSLCAQEGVTEPADLLETPQLPTALVADNDAIEQNISTLWTALTLNMIAADVLSLFIPEGMEEFTEFAGGNEAQLMAGGAVLYQFPIAMVHLSKRLSPKANRRANLVVAGLLGAAIVAGGSTTPHYIIIASVELITLAMIAKEAKKLDIAE